MLALRDAIPRAIPLACAKSTTVRLRLLKTATHPVEKTARILFASGLPGRRPLRMLAGGPGAPDPERPGARCPEPPRSLSPQLRLRPHKARSQMPNGVKGKAHVTPS